jgi:flavin-dependent dehydrogenase
VDIRSSTDRHTAAVIGAGPAGSAAAFALASAGWDVTLIEQHRFPRDKVCGECFSALGIQTLERLGLAQHIRALNPVILTQARLHAPDGAFATFALPSPMWGLSRVALDTALLAAASAAGARLLQPARCESINGRLAVRDLTSNVVEHLNPDWTLLADGKGALLPTRSAPTGDLGVKGHVKDVAAPRDAIQLLGVRGHYVGVAPIENDMWNVAFSVPASRVAAFRGDLDALWSAMLIENVALRDQFCRAVRVGQWLTSPLPRFRVTRAWPERVIPLGNAAAALEPIGGEGMGLALRSAHLAAVALTSAAPDRSAALAHLRRRYRDLWQSRSVASRAMAKLLASPLLACAGVRVARGSRALAGIAMAYVGKC